MDDIEESMKIIITPEVKQQMFDMLEYSYNENKEVGANLFLGDNNIILIGDICIGDECGVIVNKYIEDVEKIGSFHTHVTNDTIDDVPSLTDYMTLMLFPNERLTCIGTDINEPVIRCYMMKPLYEITAPLKQSGHLPQSTCLSHILDIDRYRTDYINAGIEYKSLHKSLVSSRIQLSNKKCINIMELNKNSNKDVDILINTDFNAERLSNEILHDYDAKHDFIKKVFGVDFYE